MTPQEGDEKRASPHSSSPLCSPHPPASVGPASRGTASESQEGAPSAPRAHPWTSCAPGLVHQLAWPSSALSFRG